MNLKLSIVNYQLSIILLLFFTLPLKAQVTIGAQKAPHSYSVLELESTKGGFRLPMLSNDERDALKLTSDSTEASGLFIYNTDIDCVEFWSGGKWIDLCSATPASSIVNSITLTSAAGTNAQTVCGGTAITPIKYSTTGATGATFVGLPAGVTGNWNAGVVTISGKPATSGNYIVVLTGGSGTGMAIGTITTKQVLSEISGANGVTKGATDLIYSVTPISDLATYTWTVPTGWSITSGLGTASITVTAGTTDGPAGTITVTANNGNCTGTSTLAVSVGCPVKTTSGNWLTFMCYNLGAADAVKSLTPAQQAAYTTPADELGDLYQWGRVADGHQLRSKTAVNGGSAPRTIAYDSNSQIPVGDVWYGVPVYFSGGAYDWHGNGVDKNDNLWDFTIYPENNPCPSGWRIPTSAEWGSIINSYNTWTWTVIPNGAGHLITSSGSSKPTLFLPAAGFLDSNYGGKFGTEQSGYYWSSTMTYYNGSRQGVLLCFDSTVLNTTGGYLAHAMSIRCVADQ